MKRTLKRECKGLEIAKREAAAGSYGRGPRPRPQSASGGREGKRRRGGRSALLAGARSIAPLLAPCARPRAKAKADAWRNACPRPVLKHGPRSLTYVRVLGRQTRGAKWKWGAARPAVGGASRTIDRSCVYDKRFECEHICWDPKDGELYLCRAKPRETLVEARSDSNVQIDRRIWV